MLLWFAGLAFALVWQVFRDPAIDYRLVMVGAVAPDLLDALLGSAQVLHSLLFSVVLLCAVMLGTRNRRRLRRRLLALPIGTFVHLLLDGMWTDTPVFWWPLFGADASARIPSLARPVALVAVQELAGAAALLWCWRRFRLSEPPLRAVFLRSGRLPRDVAGPGSAPTC